MPTYEYKREDGTIFEVRQGINDPALKTCPDTGQKVTRIISGGGGVMYKGDGWYVTDYKNRDSNSNGSGSNSTSGNGSPKEPSAETASDAGSPATSEQAAG